MLQQYNEFSSSPKDRFAPVTGLWYRVQYIQSRSPRIAGSGNEIAIYIATYLALINHLKRCGGLLSTQI